MKIVCYIRDTADCDLQQVIGTMVPQENIEISRTIGDLSARLSVMGHDSAIVVLLAVDQGDLEGIRSLKPLLDDKRVVLILPDRDNETVAMGHTLHPRFLTYRESNKYCVEVGAVLEKMLEAGASFKGPQYAYQGSYRAD